MSDLSELFLFGTIITNSQKGDINMDTIIANGFYTILNPTSNGPGFSPFGLIVVGNNSNYVIQIAFNFSNDIIKIRRKNNGTWVPAWKSITVS